MQKTTIYHNSQCSKSRQVLELLQNKGIQPEIIEYLKTPLNREQINKLRAHFTLNEFVRNNEPIFNELSLSLNNEEELLQAMVEHPILMQRPIVTFKNKAAIGRPPEKIMDLYE
ncbi:arsenate reductase (glutaredoxin) [uncultured Legionella sp.]|uniref:arsenate reductase (glutaredoxin) n=1 Tax=uncultured Legionella sp. TaxID=210934 RepID=UPI00260264AC|nr:arsenate reductase (glutaredoxin) [uncultured Legionella sp.]